MSDEIKNVEETEQVVKELTEKEMDKVTGGDGKIPNSPSTPKSTPII